MLTDVEYADEEGVIHVRPWSMPVDFDVLEKLVMETEARLVIIDPMNAFLVNAVDSHRDQDVRGALAPLARLAEETGPAVVLIRHLTKAGGANALYPRWRLDRHHRRSQVGSIARQGPHRSFGPQESHGAGEGQPRP